PDNPMSPEAIDEVFSNGVGPISSITQFRSRAVTPRDLCFHTLGSKVDSISPIGCDSAFSE
ncbi:MAG: hypothetical protein QF535_11740, partial [Anaerolineales bacterium]|nr:hypothetical protein [Anaerolineales bacterium]